MSTLKDSSCDKTQNSKNKMVIKKKILSGDKIKNCKL